MAKTFKLEVVTPEKRFYDGQAEMVIVRTLKGEEGFKANHTPACMMLDVGEMRIYEPGGNVRIASAADGFIDVESDDIMIFVDSAEWPNEIDVDRLKRKKEEIEEKLKHPSQFDKAHIWEFKKTLKKIKIREKVLNKNSRTKKI